MKKLCFALSAIVLALVACSTNGSYTDREFTSLSAFPMKTAQTPAKGEEFEVEPGKSILSSTRHSVVPAIRLEQDLKHEGKYSDTYDSLITIAAGVLTASGKDAGGTFYEAGQPISFVYKHLRTGKNSDAESLRGGIYIPTDTSKAPEVYWYWEGEYTPASYPHPGLAYKSLVAEHLGKDGYKRELVYAGVAQNTISVAYREFKEDPTRPIYHQDLKYDLSQGNVIAYQGARFQVLKADNTKVRYKVLNPLD